MAKRSLIELILCLMLVMAGVNMATANETDPKAPIDAGVVSVSSAGTSETATLLAADEVKSANIKEADGTSGQNTNAGSGIKTNHIQNSAVTSPKISNGAVTTTKIAAGAVTDLKITGPIKASKIGFTGLNADLVDGLHASSFAVSTHKHDAAYVNVSGDTMTGSLTATSFIGNGAELTNVNHNKTTCPSTKYTPFTKVDFTNSTLCIARDTYEQTWNTAQDSCNTVYAGASICTHQQVRRACHQVGLALIADSWLADRINDNYALYVNQTYCDDFDGISEVLTTERNGVYCCLEWMKY